jgi:tetratricopeptide (TPR) repeat protein
MHPMNKTFRRALWTAALLVALASPASADPADEHVLKGNKAVQKKDLKKAVLEYEEALKISPSHAKANLLLGMTYANTGDFEKAEKYVKSSLKLQPSYDGFHTLGLIYSNKGDFLKAVEAYQNAVQMNPQAYRAWYHMAQVHSANGNFKSAVDAYKKSIELNPQFWDGYQGLGTAYYWSGEKLQALEQVNQLKMVKAKEKAQQLEKWIEAKEKQKLDKAKGVPAPASSPA